MTTKLKCTNTHPAPLSIEPSLHACRKPQNHKGKHQCTLCGIKWLSGEPHPQEIQRVQKMQNDLQSISNVLCESHNVGCNIILEAMHFLKQNSQASIQEAINYAFLKTYHFKIYQEGAKI